MDESSKNPVPKVSKGLIATALFCGGMALIASYSTALLVCYLGFLFSGLDTGFAILVAIVIVLFTTILPVAILQPQAHQFTWRSLGIQSSLIAMVVVGFMAWFLTRSFFEHNFIKLVPKGIHVHHGRTVMFGSFVHFSAPPEVVTAIIQARQLAPPSEAQASAQERSRAPWGWWNPARMSNPRFFVRQRKSDTGQYWTQGIWVNDATNEVYAYTSS